MVKLSLLVLFILGLYAFALYWLGKGSVDMHYSKLNQKAGSLVLGISRAHDGISPKVLKSELKGLDINDSIVNFAFDKFQSPYGKIYLNAVRKKIRTSKGNGVFILSVSPGSFTTPKKVSDERIIEIDQRMSIGKIENFTENPNYDYIINCYAKSLYTAFVDNSNFTNQVSHPDGWNEVQREVSNHIITQEESAFLKGQMVVYLGRFENEVLSKHRLNNFVETIQFLKKKGHVAVVRMPAEKEIIALENKFWPGFSKKFDSISKNQQVPFLDYSAIDGYETYDGSHMFSESAKKFSKVLAEDLKELILSKSNQSKH